MKAGAPKENKVLRLNHTKKEVLYQIFYTNTTTAAAYLQTEMKITLEPHIQNNDRRAK